MTLIEFFDSDAIENIAACLSDPPERIIFLGDDMVILDAHANRYRAILAGRKIPTQIICRSVNRNQLHRVVDELEKLVNRYENCIFDLTGGDETFLVAAGIITERYPEKKIGLRRINLKNGTVYACDMEEKSLPVQPAPTLSVKENIAVYGGEMVLAAERDGGTYPWQYTPDFEADIAKMWEICRKDTRAWNVQTDFLGEGAKLSKNIGSLRFELLTTDFPYFVHFVQDNDLLNKLYAAGLLTAFDTFPGGFAVTFKNLQVKMCLIKAGQALEMKITSIARSLCGDENAPYQEAVCGVGIDWDGADRDGSETYDAFNEIDVMLMHGTIPVFVSCKNGFIDKEEVYKLSTVADRFGGKYAKKVLIATSINKGSDFAKYLAERTKELGIRLVDDILNASDAEMQRVIASFWSN